LRDTIKKYGIVFANDIRMCPITIKAKYLDNYASKYAMIPDDILITEVIDIHPDCKAPD
jgi:hypothetical protein